MNCATRRGALDAARGRYFDLYDFAPVGYCTLAGNGQILQANLTLAVLLGVARSSLVDQRITRFIFAPDQDQYYLLTKQVLALPPATENPEGKSHMLDLRLLRGNGSPLWVNLVARAATGDSGEPVLRVMATDITARRQAEETLQRRTAFLEAMIDSPVDGILVLDQDGNKLYQNARMVELWKIPPQFAAEQDDGAQFAFLTSRAKDPAEFVARIADMNAHPTKMSRDEIELTDGTFLERTSAAVEGNDQTFFGRIWTFRDITPRQRADQALHASLLEKTALLKEVHHRVKNNLQVITSLLRLENGRSAEARTKAVLTAMQGRIHSMALLHESLYRTGIFATVDLSQYLRQLTAQSFRTLGAAPGTVRLQQDLAPLTVGMDLALPCGLLVNELLSNALKHGFPPGHSGEIRVELQPIAGGPQWRLGVSDTGAGLPADFEAKRGHSLGLQLVTDLVAQIRGELTIGPAPSAAFSVTFTPEVSA